MVKWCNQDAIVLQDTYHPAMNDVNIPEQQQGLSDSATK